MKNFNHLIKASQNLNPHCPICNVKYDVARIQILNENENGILSYFTCTHCESSFLASIVETPFGHMATGLLTDLDAEEVFKFAQEVPITHDDVIEAHELLENGELL